MAVMSSVESHKRQALDLMVERLLVLYIKNAFNM
jgi:hypothetical protein